VALAIEEHAPGNPARLLTVTLPQVAGAHHPSGNRGERCLPISSGERRWQARRRTGDVRRSLARPNSARATELFHETIDAGRQPGD
jgi:hypothetical protein